MDSRNLIYRFKKYILDFVYGNFCPVCKKPIEWDRLLCENCIQNLNKLEVDSCKICGHIVCKNHNEISYDNAATIFLYDDICKECIYKLKSGGEYNFAEYCGEKIAEKIRKENLDSEIDLITAVPMSFSKKGERGYNHAEIIGKFIGRNLNKPCNFKLLQRNSDKSEQHKLEYNQRKAHAEKIYRKRKHHTNISGKTILIADDVLTSGSTMNKCSRLLKEMGAKNVICVAIAVSDLKILIKGNQMKE